MAARPDVLVLDEPTSQLDPIAASDFLATVHRINRELGTTVVMSEHRLEEVYGLTDRVVVLEEGRVVADGEPRAVAGQLHREGSFNLQSRSLFNYGRVGPPQRGGGPRAVH